jgi:hypothetical protein
MEFRLDEGEEKCIQDFCGKARKKEITSMWEDNIKKNLRLIGWVGMDGIDLAQERD